MFKVAVGFETDVVPIVHMTHFCQLGTGGLDYKNKIKITWHLLGASCGTFSASFLSSSA